MSEDKRPVCTSFYINDPVYPVDISCWSQHAAVHLWLEIYPFLAWLGLIWLTFAPSGCGCCFLQRQNSRLEMRGKHMQLSTLNLFYILHFVQEAILILRYTYILQYSLYKLICLPVKLILVHSELTNLIKILKRLYRTMTRMEARFVISYHSTLSLDLSHLLLFIYLGPYIHIQESVWRDGSCKRRVHSINLQHT